MQFPIRTKALRVDQPMGSFYIATLPARVLIEVAYSDALSATWSDEAQGYRLQGTQRLRDPKRLKPISDYISREDAAFPNAIIIAANQEKDTGLVQEIGSPDESQGSPPISQNDLWTIEEHDDGCHELIIPSGKKIVSVIDGQHRLFSFADAIPKRLDMQLICAIFLDLPRPYQAQLFATINSNQKPVDKSLTYEMFGYNIDEETEEFWSPDKLAVYLSRRLAVDGNSPLAGRIIIAPVRDEILQRIAGSGGWKVSTAVIVDGIMRLFTSNPKSDTAALLKDRKKTRLQISGARVDRSPLRALYIQQKDAVIYAIVLNFLIACDKVFWNKAPTGSYITKTVGVQALLDILRRLARPMLEERDISADAFEQRLTAASGIDFTAVEFRNASGAGRSDIRRAIEASLNLPPLGRRAQ
jgi:DNA phosphorothioation-associated DGQHR protein 1